jgi:hypothetical protein
MYYKKNCQRWKDSKNFWKNRYILSDDRETQAETGIYAITCRAACVKIRKVVRNSPKGKVSS